MRADLVLFSAPFEWCEKTFTPVRPADVGGISSYLQMCDSAHNLGSNGD
jgi:hypothetical protein